MSANRHRSPLDRQTPLAGGIIAFMTGKITLASLNQYDRDQFVESLDMCTKSLTILAGSFSIAFLLPPESVPRAEGTGSVQHQPVPLPSEREVKSAFDQLYVALDGMLRGELNQLSEVWSHSSTVTYMGPFGGRQVGWDRVHAQLKREAAMKLRCQWSPENLMIRVGGDLAYALCIEHAELQGSAKPSWSHRRATNIFRREGGKWKLVHRQTDKTPEQQEPASE